MSKQDDRNAAEQTFHALFLHEPETPESLLVKVMNGQTTITKRGKQMRITKEMQKAAELLLPYRLPRLNSIDAVNRNVEMTTEEWIKSLDEGNAE